MPRLYVGTTQGRDPLRLKNLSGMSPSQHVLRLYFAQVVAEATTLRLSYKNVLKIDNLQGFSRLTKLCLDNNIIESIRYQHTLRSLLTIRANHH